MRYLPACLFCLALLTTQGHTHDLWDLPDDPRPVVPTPTPAPLLGEMSTDVSSLSVALVGGVWRVADTRTIAATVTIDSNAKWVQVRVRRLVTVKIGNQSIDVLSAEAIPVLKLEAKAGRCYGVVAGEGRYQVEAICSDPQVGISTEVAVIQIGKPPEPDKPDPPPEPDKPDVPPDAFDNIGQKVAGWATGLPKRAETAAVYAKWADQLRSNPMHTINTASTAMVAERVSVLSSDSAAYQSLVDQLNADFQGRWPMAKGLVADYWDAVAAGLGAE